ncbi:MAG: metal ABC transporter ATP-binding protein [Clostridium sp.]|nr:metal ABC transporter ATP-binding protein [Clostridium sp.]
MIYSNKKILESNINENLSFLELKNLSVKINKNTILNNINMKVNEGEFLALIGINGAGKSTLLKSILGEIDYNGSISFNNENSKLHKNICIGYVPQKLEFDLSSPLTVEEVFGALLRKIPVYLPLKKYKRKKIKEMLKEVEGEDLIYKRLGVLSGGELQRVLLALAINPIPDILLLDEPVSGIDQKGLKLFYKMISELRKKYNMTVILITHDLKLLKDNVDKVAFLNNGVIEAMDTSKNIFYNEKVIEVFGRV